MMRQAGRYLPEYRELRAQFPSFLDFVRHPESATRATLQPLERYPLDAAILFSDILVMLPPLGFELQFVEGKGPQIENQIDANLSNLEDYNFNSFEPSQIPATREAIQRVQETLHKNHPGTPLLGFVGGPFTVASYASEAKKLFFQNPELYHSFLNRLSQNIADYALAQIQWGCDALVVMDSWAGTLSPQEYQEAALPYTQNIVRRVKQQTGAPVIHYANGAGHLLSPIISLGCDCVGLDWRTDLESVFEHYPNQMFQGNLDPHTLFAPPAVVAERTQELLRKIGTRPHILHLGHGVLPGTPVESVAAFLNSVHV
jgi:uroporphyrinogen decarboxylase